MSFTTWDSKCSVDVDEMDSQHKKLIAIINDLYKAMMSGRSQDVAESTLDELIRYTIDHFSAEEELMQSPC